MSQQKQKSQKEILDYVREPVKDYPPPELDYDELPASAAAQYAARQVLLEVRKRIEEVLPELDDGRHHLSVAGLMDGAVAKAQIFRFENVVDSLTTDGACWCIMDEYGYTRLEEAESAEVAFLYELYRHKNCRKRGAFCVNCGYRVDYIVTPTPDRATIRGIEFDYVEQIATCNQCGSEVYVADVYNANVQMREEAFRKAKDLPKPI